MVLHEPTSSHSKKTGKKLFFNVHFTLPSSHGSLLQDSPQSPNLDDNTQFTSDFEVVLRHRVRRDQLQRYKAKCRSRHPLTL